MLFKSYQLIYQLFNSSIAYYMRAKSRSNIGMVKILKDMLRMEGIDKEFLLAEITKLTQGRDAMFSMAERQQQVVAQPSKEVAIRLQREEGDISRNVAETEFSQSSNYERHRLDGQGL